DALPQYTTHFDPMASNAIAVLNGIRHTVTSDLASGWRHVYSMAVSSFRCYLYPNAILFVVAPAGRERYTRERHIVSRCRTMQHNMRGPWQYANAHLLAFRNVNFRVKPRTDRPGILPFMMALVAYEDSMFMLRFSFMLHGRRRDGQIALLVRQCRHTRIGAACLPPTERAGLSLRTNERNNACGAP